MRIRKAAIAGATALAVAFSGTAVAVAETPQPEKPSSSSFNLSSKDGKASDSDKKDEIGALSSKIGKSLEADKPADGRKIFGADTDWTSQPKWAQALLGVGIASAVITALAGVIGPILNFIKFGPLF